jgi:predicted RNase H-like HicB family nuclease
LKISPMTAMEPSAENQPRFAAKTEKHMQNSRDTAAVLRAGMEEMEPECWVLSVFDLIGCFSSGRSEEEAAALAERRVRGYFEWLGKKDGNPAPFEDAVRVEIVERFQSGPRTESPSQNIRAFYEDDSRPLRPWDLDMGLRILDWNRQDLLRLISKPPPDPKAENIAKRFGMLVHLAEEENKILAGLGAAVESSAMPDDPLGKIQTVRLKFRGMLPARIESQGIVEVRGEKWSPRKALRRALWHERDHVEQMESTAP